jgi:site-specific recombinase XerD
MQLHNALALFLQAKEAEGAARKTLRSYHDHVTHFLASLPAASAVLGAVKASDITRYLAVERSRGMSEATVYGRYRAIDLFFTWCSENEEVGMPLSPLKNLRGKRVVKVKKPGLRDPRRAELAVVDALLAGMPPVDWLSCRNRVAVRLLRDTGVRLSEAANVRLVDLDLVGRQLRIACGKGNKVRYVCFTAALVEEIAGYLAKRPRCPPGVEAYLFVAAWNRQATRGVRGRLTASGLQQMLACQCRRLGLPHVNPHAIRHLFATKALNDGLRLETVSALMGHSDPSFTRRAYAALLQPTVQREYERHWA